MNYRVTSSLLVGPGAAVDRLREERRILRKHFPGFVLKKKIIRVRKIAEVVGRIRTRSGRSYGIRIVLPRGYPHVLPVILPDGWRPKPNPHLLVGGALCVMKDSQWTSSMSIAFLVAKASLWLHKYDVYLEKGIWPGRQQPH